MVENKHPSINNLILLNVHSQFYVIIQFHDQPPPKVFNLHFQLGMLSPRTTSFNMDPYHS